MNASIIYVKIIFETIKLKIWGSEHAALKKYWRIKMKKSITAIEKIITFFNFFQRQKSSRQKFWQVSSRLKPTHRKNFLQKNRKFNGSRMLRCGVINDLKIKFQQTVIEKLQLIQKIDARITFHFCDFEETKVSKCLTVILNFFIIFKFSSKGK